MTKASTATFAFAGVSTLAGETKVRFANDQLRVKVLTKNGHTDINLIELPGAMLKEDAIAHLISVDFGAGNEAIEQALQDAVEARAVAPAKEPKAPKVAKEKKVKAAKPTLEGIAAKGKAQEEVAAALEATAAESIAATEAAVIADANEEAPF